MFELLFLFVFFFFFIVICFILFVAALISHGKKDKRAVDADEKIAELPPIHFHSLQHDSSQRLWSGELLESNHNVLDDFNFKNGVLALRTKSGKCVSGLLNNMTVRFEKIRTDTYITIRSDRNEIQIHILGNFLEKQWETMIGVLMLAGTTYGSEIFSAKYNNLDKAKIALQVIKIVSQLS